MLQYWAKRLIYLLRNSLFLGALSSHKRSKYKEIPDKILPVLTIGDLTDESEPELVETEHHNGNVSLEELRCIAKIVRFHQPKTIFEIGTFDGRTTMNMAINAKESELFTLDLPQKESYRTKFRIKKGDLTFIDKEVSGKRFIGTEFESRITQIYADSAQFDYEPYNNKIDLVFIDGSHTYEYVISDTKKALKLLKNGKGVIIWHDYGWREVVTALNEFYLDDTSFADLKNIGDTSLAYLHLQ